MKSENWIKSELNSIRDKHLLRTLTTFSSSGGHVLEDGKKLINFSSNDYLNFAHNSEIQTASSEAVMQHGTGSGSSRLVTGSLPLHEELEDAAAGHKGYPAALFFGSGYMANLGIVTSLVGRGDTVIADRLIHASLIDAVRLSGAQLIRFHHNDVEHAASCFNKANRNGRVLMITESVFSMEGDLAPLAELAELAVKKEALFLVDEAHASGIFGPRGGGLIAEHGLQAAVNISMSTFSKALGGYGGVVGCSESMKQWLINHARSFIYTTAPPPGVCASNLAALDQLQKQPQLGEELLARARLFRALLNGSGFDTGMSASQIVPVMLGKNEDALAMADALREHGIVAGAIRPPTVPRGSARLRFSITLAHSEEELHHAADAAVRCIDKLKLRHILKGG